MPDKTSRYLLSDADSLRRIKFAQFRSQVPALVLLALAIALNTIFPSYNLYSWALGLALVAIAWYLLVGLSHRFKQRIPLPPEGALLSPIQGKVSFIRGSGDLTLLSIRKVLLDSVEIRCPHPDCQLEDGALHWDSLAGRISFRFSFGRIQWFPQAEFAAGSIIGMAVGAGNCTVSFPGSPALAVKAGDPIDVAQALVADPRTDLLNQGGAVSPILEVTPDYAPEEDKL